MYIVHVSERTGSKPKLHVSACYTLSVNNADSSIFIYCYVYNNYLGLYPDALILPPCDYHVRIFHLRLSGTMHKQLTHFVIEKGIPSVDVWLFWFMRHTHYRQQTLHVVDGKDIIY